MKFEIKTHVKKRPNWLLYLLACFPFDRDRDFQERDRNDIIAAVMNYLKTFTYKRRNSMERLDVTHSISRTEQGIEIRTINDTLCLTINLI